MDSTAVVVETDVKMIAEASVAISAGHRGDATPAELEGTIGSFEKQNKTKQN